MIRGFTVAVLIALTPPPAIAADLSAETTTIAPVPTGLWRGHFSGGLNYDPPAADIALAWNDQVAFFPTDAGCRRWLRELRSEFRTYQGYSGCVQIR